MHGMARMKTNMDSRDGMDGMDRMEFHHSEFNALKSAVDKLLENPEIINTAEFTFFHQFLKQWKEPAHGESTKAEEAEKLSLEKSSAIPELAPVNVETNFRWAHLWLRLAYFRIGAMCACIVFGWTVLYSIEGSRDYRPIQSSWLQCHAIFYPYSQFGGRVDFGTYGPSTQKPSPDEIERWQWGRQAHRYFGGDWQWREDRAGFDNSWAYRGEDMDIYLISRDNTSWLMLVGGTGRQVPMGPTCGGDEPGLYQFVEASFWDLKISLIVWLLFRIMGLYLEWIVMCGLAKAKIFSACGFDLIKKMGCDVMSMRDSDARSECECACCCCSEPTGKCQCCGCFGCSTSMCGALDNRWWCCSFFQKLCPNTSTFCKDAAKATWFKWLVQYGLFTLAPSVVINPILSLKLNDVCRQIVTTSYSSSIQRQMNVGLGIAMADLICMALACRRVLSKRGEAPAPKEYINKNNGTPRKLLWLNHSEGKGVRKVDENVVWLRVPQAVTVKGLVDDDDKVDVEVGDIVSKLTEGSRHHVKAQDIYKPFTYDVIDPAQVWWESACLIWCELTRDAFWNATTLIVIIIDSWWDFCKNGAHFGGGVLWPMIALAWCMICGGLLGACVLLAVMIVIGLIITLIFLAQAPILPVLVLPCLLVYQLVLALEAFELPYFFFNLSWLTWFRYPQYNLAFNLSMFYMFALVVGGADFLANVGLLSSMQTREKLRKKAREFWKSDHKGAWVKDKAKEKISKGKDKISSWTGRQI